MEDLKKIKMVSYFEGLPDEMNDIKEYFIPRIETNEPINELMDYSRDRISILLDSRFLEEYDKALEYTYRKDINQIWKYSEDENWLIQIPNNDSKYFTDKEPNKLYKELEDRVRNFDIQEVYIIGDKKYYTKNIYYNPLVNNLTGNGICIVFHDLSTVFLNKNGEIDTINLNGSKVGVNIFTNGDTGNKECYLASRSFGYPRYSTNSIGLDDNLNPYTVYINDVEIPIEGYNNKDGVVFASIQTIYYTNTSCSVNSELLLQKENNKSPYILELEGIEYLIYEINDDHLVMSDHKNKKLNQIKYYYNPNYNKSDIINIIKQGKNIDEILWKVDIFGDTTYINSYREGTFNKNIGEPSLLEIEKTDEEYRIINAGNYGGGYCIDEDNKIIYKEIAGRIYSSYGDCQGVKDYRDCNGAYPEYYEHKNTFDSIGGIVIMIDNNTGKIFDENEKIIIKEIDGKLFHLTYLDKKLIYKANDGTILEGEHNTMEIPLEFIDSIERIMNNTIKKIAYF